MRHSDVWNGNYRGVSFKIVNWKLGSDKDAWNFYLRLMPEQIPAAKLPLFDLPPVPQKYGRHKLGYDYFGSALADLNWHCGITYYEKYCLPTGQTSIIEAGCDFQHLWDEGMDFDVDRVLFETKRCIDSLWEQHPDFLVFCSHSGCWAVPSDGKFSDDGEYFYCNACLAKQAAERAKADVAQS